jgi:hypothetical protein
MLETGITPTKDSLRAAGLDDLSAVFEGNDWRDLASASPEREMPFMMHIGVDGSNCWVHGRMDAAVAPENGVPRVIDYKYAAWREGGEARLLTSGSGTKSDPVFSPDGSLIAFTGDYDGNVDVYVMPSAGGVPRRLTHHPAVDEVVGWAPDGKSVLFRSTRNSYSRFNRLFTVTLDGGLPHELPLPTAEFGAFSSDGKHIAYVPVDNNRRLSAIGWKRYRGGKASRVWIADLADLGLDEDVRVHHVEPPGSLRPPMLALGRRRTQRGMMRRCSATASRPETGWRPRWPSGSWRHRWSCSRFLARGWEERWTPNSHLDAR